MALPNNGFYGVEVGIRDPPRGFGSRLGFAAPATSNVLDALKRPGTEEPNGLDTTRNGNKLPGHSFGARDSIPSQLLSSRALGLTGLWSTIL